MHPAFLCSVTQCHGVKVPGSLLCMEHYSELWSDSDPDAPHNN